MGQLGDTLRERRLSLGITLPDASEHLKIRERLLQAIEDGDYSSLPNPGYVRGYVSSYARYLELDPLPLLAMYRAETGATRFHELEDLPGDTAVKPVHQQHAIPWRVGLLALGVVVVVSIAIWVGIRLSRGPQDVPPIPSTPSAATSTASPGTTTQSGAPFVVVVKVAKGAASTLKVTVDGLSAFNGSLTSGQSKTFNASTQVDLIVGTPSKVTVTRDGQKVAVPSTSPAKMTMTATPAP
jgi:cytoskeleton protein RodZ